MYRNLLIVLAAAITLSCSEKTNPSELRFSKEKEISVGGDVFMVLVNGTGVWSVLTDENWIHTENRYFTDEAAFEVRCDSNESSEGDHRFCRIGRIQVNAWDDSWTGEVIIRQEGLVPIIKLSPVLISASEGVYAMPMETNLRDRERKGLSFSCDASWISDLAFGKDGESITFKATAGSSRSADLVVTFTDAWGRSFTESSKINQ